MRFVLAVGIAAAALASIWIYAQAWVRSVRRFDELQAERRLRRGLREE